jgi:hypothetical protein
MYDDTISFSLSSEEEDHLQTTEPSASLVEESMNLEEFQERQEVPEPVEDDTLDMENKTHELMSLQEQFLANKQRFLERSRARMQVSIVFS